MGPGRLSLPRGISETLESNYRTGLRNVDFVGDHDGARGEVNEWVEEATDGRIDELLPAESVTEDTRLVVTNAVALFADWAEAFDPDDTRERTFTALDGSTDEVQMMSQTEDFPYAHGEDYQAIELPYVGEDVSMVIVVPRPSEAAPDADGTREAFESFEADLDADRIAGIFDALEKREAMIQLPRFEFDVEFELAAVLGDLGMPDPFDPERANFEGVAPTEAGSDDLFDVYHEAYVSVNEEGTEAIAATGFSGGLESGPLTVTADRPFLFSFEIGQPTRYCFSGGSSTLRAHSSAVQRCTAGSNRRTHEFDPQSTRGGVSPGRRTSRPVTTGRGIVKMQ
ncbi:serpin family protein [Natrialba swarupiae]|nr:serpin family protein [Natrialba swarupiae]